MIQTPQPSLSRTLQGGLFGALKTALIWGGIATLAVGGFAALAAATGGIGIPGLFMISVEGSALTAFMAGAGAALPWAAGITGALGFFTGATQARHAQKMEIMQAQQAAIDAQLQLQPGLARQVSFEGPGHPANDKRMEFTDMIAQQRARQTVRGQGA